MRGTFTFKPLKANLTHSTEMLLKMDPYCSFTVGTQKFKSQICKSGGKNPVWSDEIQIPIDSDQQFCYLQLMDQDRLTKDDNIGTATIDLFEVMNNTNRFVSKWYPIFYKNKSAGEILLEIAFVPGGQTFTNQPFVSGTGTQNIREENLPSSGLTGKSTGYPLGSGSAQNVPLGGTSGYGSNIGTQGTGYSANVQGQGTSGTSSYGTGGPGSYGTSGQGGYGSNIGTQGTQGTQGTGYGSNISGQGTSGYGIGGPGVSGTSGLGSNIGGQGISGTSGYGSNLGTQGTGYGSNVGTQGTSLGQNVPLVGQTGFGQNVGSQTGVYDQTTVPLQGTTGYKDSLLGTQGTTGTGYGQNITGTQGTSGLGTQNLGGQGTTGYTQSTTGYTQGTTGYTQGTRNVTDNLRGQSGFVQPSGSLEDPLYGKTIDVKDAGERAVYDRNYPSGGLGQGNLGQGNLGQGNLGNVGQGNLNKNLDQFNQQPGYY